MDDFRVTVTASPQELDELEALCRRRGIATERDLRSEYEGVAVTVFVLHATAPFDVLAQCIADYGTMEHAPLKVSYVIPGKGSFVLEDYSGAESVAAVLRQTQELSFVREPELTQD